MKEIELFSLFNEMEFEILHGMMLLFDKNSKYFEYSGFVTAALYEFETDNRTVLAINCSKGWITFKLTKDELEDMLKNCVEFVGKDEESSFKIKL